MLEESISCSPGCETNRSQSRRLHSRFKRKHRRPENRTSPTDVSRLKGLYEESDHALNSTQYEHFNPFKNEKLLAAVDMVRVPKSPSTLRDFPSAGFVKLEDLPMKEDDDFQEHIQEVVTSCPHNQTNSELHAQYGPETQFGITESEFVRFCDDAELDVQEPTSIPAETPQKEKTVVEMIMDDFCSSSFSESSPKFEAEEKENTTANSSKTPHTKKSVVEAILEDFCASPYNESPPKAIAENATPVFRFRSLCIRTYAGTRRRRLRRNIDTEFANSQLTDDDGSVSDSSGLSVQEDLTQSVVPQLDTVDLNCSIKVCENLLHLSSYFSQATSHDKTPQSSEEQKSRPLSEVVEEIIQLKRKSYDVTRRKSSDEFYGFSDGDSIEEFHGFSDEENKLHEHTLKELLDAEDDVLQHINCDSLCYEKVQQKTSFSCNVSDIDLGVERVKSVIDDAKKFMQSLDGMLEAEETDTNPTTCDSLKIKEETLFEDIDLWNDNECLLNYVTQKPNLKQETCLVKTETAESDIRAGSMNGFGFSTASKKLIAISEEAKRKANEFWSKFEQSEKEREAVDNEENPNSAWHEKVVAGQCAVYTASSRKYLVSEVHPPDETPSTSSFSKAHTSRQISTFSSKGNENQRKANELSDDIEQEAEDLLKDIEFFEDGFEEEQKAVEIGKFIACIEAPSSKSQFEGFKTVSKKSIAVSDEAKRRADLLIKDVKAEDMPKDFLESLQADLKQEAFSKVLTEDTAKDVMAFEGFKTASKKPIEISEVAKRRAEQISKDVQTADLPREFLECIQADLKDGESICRAGKEQGPIEVKFEGFKTASKKPIKISEVAKRRAEQISKDVQTADLPREFLECIQADLKDGDLSNRSGKEQGPIGVKFEGFKTPSKKPIQISEVAKCRAEQISKDVQAVNLPREFLECIQADLKDGDSSNQSGNEQGPIEVKFEGFKTASKKPIKISEVAKRRAEQISKDVQAVDLPREFLECIQADLKNGDSSNQSGNEQGPIEVKFEGFKTASKKPIKISDVAKQRAEQMLKEIKTAPLPQDFLKCVEADLDDNSKTAAVGEHSALKTISISDAVKQPADELISDIESRVHLPADISECIQSKSHVEGTPKRNNSCIYIDNTKLENRIHRACPHEAQSTVLSPQKINELDYHKAIKRKADILHAEESLISPKRRFSCNDRTPLNGIENAPLHKTSSHPDIKSTQKIVKKNLLSLSKRKKCNSSKQTADTSAASKTPEKPDSSLLRCNANTTPNLKEFFNCVATSTPRLMRTNSKVDSNQKDSSIDADFKRINWENSNNSARVCKTTDLNITCIEVSPSPKQRIERLKMYAEPPPISPILMVNKCRPSGLRRGRSLMKP